VAKRRGGRKTDCVNGYRENKRRELLAIENELLDKLLADYKKPGDIIGENSLLKQLTKALRGIYSSASEADDAVARLS
jgi:hypothetical protein